MKNNFICTFEGLYTCIRFYVIESSKSINKVYKHKTHLQFVFCVFDFRFCFCFFIISYNAFWFLCSLLLPLCSISSKRIKKKSNLCYSYAHWCMTQFPVASPLKITESLPNPILKVINHELPYFSLCITILNVCLP